MLGNSKVLKSFKQSLLAKKGSTRDNESTTKKSKAMDMSLTIRKSNCNKQQDEVAEFLAF